LNDQIGTITAEKEQLSVKIEEHDLLLKGVWKFPVQAVFRSASRPVNWRKQQPGRSSAWLLFLLRRQSKFNYGAMWSLLFVLRLWKQKNLGRKRPSVSDLSQASGSCNESFPVNGRPIVYWRVIKQF
jgi:hypothetical protein